MFLNVTIVMHIFFFLNNFIYKTITYTTYSINYTYIVLATNTNDTYTYMYCDAYGLET